MTTQRSRHPSPRVQNHAQVRARPAFRCEESADNTSELRSPVDDTIVVILAKAPIPGFVKTRLIPALGPDGSAAVAQVLLGHAIREALGARVDRVELCLSPDTAHPAIAGVLEPFSRPDPTSRHSGARVATQLCLSRQADGDLGARMHAAMVAKFGRYRRVLLMGTDAPALTSNIIEQASQALDQTPVVLVPALDGGYALIGLTEPAPFLFEDMAWSTSAVLSATRQRLRERHWSWIELDPVADIDEPADLVHLPPSLWPVGIEKLSVQEPR